MHRRHALVLWAATLATLLAACDGSDDPPPVAPQITSGPQSLTVGEGQSAEFAVSATGTPAPQFEWFIDGTGAVAGAAAATYVRNAASLLDDGRRFGVTASNSAGSVTSALATLSVTERSWSTGALPPSGANGTQPAVALGQPQALVVDSRGHSHALFSQQESNGSWTIWTALKPAGQSQFGAFSRLSPLPATPSEGAFAPRLAADASGRVLALWLTFNALEQTSLTAALYTPSGSSGGSWGAPQAVSTALRAWVGDAVVAATADGVFDVVYEATAALDNARDIVARRLTVAGGTATWDDEVVLDANSTSATVRPRLAATGQGQVVAMWSEGGAYTSVKAASRGTTGNWSSAQDVGGQANENLEVASVAVDAQGRGVAAMMGDQTRVWLSRFEVGSSGLALLGTSQYVHNYTYGHVPPVAVAGTNGQPEVISLHGDGHQISRVRFDGDGWLPQETVHFVDSGGVVDVVGSLRAGMDSAGNLMVLWTEQTQPNSYPLLRARRHHAGLAQWRALADLFTTGLVFGQATLTVMPDGSAQVLIPQGDFTLAQAQFR